MLKLNLINVTLITTVYQLCIVKMGKIEWSIGSENNKNLTGY